MKLGEEQIAFVEHIHLTLTVPNYFEFALNIMHQNLTVRFNVPLENDGAFVLTQNNAYDIRIAAHSDLRDVCLILIQSNLEVDFFAIFVFKMLVNIKVVNHMIVVDK